VTDARNLPTLELARAALVSQGIEILRADASELAVAKRVRSHLMDAGVSLQFVPEPTVRFVVRAQSSDFPGVGAKQLYEKVRADVAASARAHGFVEVAQQPREILDPGDRARVLDVWHELVFTKPIHDPDKWIDDVRWAMSVSKCVG
jgi:hypothetical protein